MECDREGDVLLSQVQFEMEVIEDFNLTTSQENKHFGHPVNEDFVQGFQQTLTEILNGVSVCSTRGHSFLLARTIVGVKWDSPDELQKTTKKDFVNAEKFNSSKCIFKNS